LISQDIRNTHTAHATAGRKKVPGEDRSIASKIRKKLRTSPTSMCPIREVNNTDSTAANKKIFRWCFIILPLTSLVKS
jgi:hypothetical protein